MAPTPDSMVDEFSLIARFFNGLDDGPAVSLGNGDDAAVLRLEEGECLAVSVDTMVEGVHFPQGADAALAVYRAVGAAASDLAAMGARPLAMTLALTLPEPDERWLADCRRGLERACEAFDLPLVGGDLTRGSLTLSVQVMGATGVRGALRRCGARPGDRLFVSGALGDAAAGLAVLHGELTLPEESGDYLMQRFWQPAPALALGEDLAGCATACIDVSDGLLADARHLATASAVGLRIDSARLPLSEVLRSSVPREQALRWALSGGEDYVLCFTLPPQIQTPPGVTEIGEVTEGSGVECDMLVSSAGYRHFAGS